MVRSSPDQAGSGSFCRQTQTRHRHRNPLADEHADGGSVALAGLIVWNHTIGIKRTGRHVVMP